MCPARYKTRPGLTYHYAHSHKEERRQQRAEPGYEPPPPAPDQEASPAAPEDESPSVPGWPHASSPPRPPADASAFRFAAGCAWLGLACAPLTCLLCRPEEAAGAGRSERLVRH